MGEGAFSTRPNGSLRKIIADYWSARRIGCAPAGRSVTSPYLNKPKRALDQALRDRGMTPEDVGYGRPPEARRRRPSEGEARPLRRAPMVAALGGAAAIALVVLVASWIDDTGDAPAPIAEEQIDALQKIAPAAGE